MLAYKAPVCQKTSEASINKNDRDSLITEHAFDFWKRAVFVHQKAIEISFCFSKLERATVGSLFFGDTVCNFDRLQVNVVHSSISLRQHWKSISTFDAVLGMCCAIVHAPTVNDTVN